jgi:hypothetical protein
VVAGSVSRVCVVSLLGSICFRRPFVPLSPSLVPVPDVLLCCEASYLLYLIRFRDLGWDLGFMKAQSAFHATWYFARGTFYICTTTDNAMLPGIIT